MQKAILAESEVKSVSSFIGGRGSSNQANLFLQLQDKSERSDTPTDLINRISTRLSKLVGADFFLMEPGAVRAGARQSNASYQYTLEGENASELYTWTDKLQSELRRHPQLTDRSDMEWPR